MGSAMPVLLAQPYPCLCAYTHVACFCVYKRVAEVSQQSQRLQNHVGGVLLNIDLIFLQL